MTEVKFKDRYRIASARAAWHDYLGGAYFVTICTHDKEYYFGRIVGGQMVFSKIGDYANGLFQDVSTYYPYAEIPAFVVMPNHIHAIVIIDGWIRNDITCRDAIHHVSETTQADTQRGGITGHDNPMLYRSLGTVIRGLKGRVSHFANENGLVFIWQSRFHDRIIRNQDAMNEFALYIENNVPRWHEDDLCLES